MNLSLQQHSKRAASAMRASFAQPEMADFAEQDLATIIDQRDEARARAQRLATALQKSMSWLTSYPGGGADKCYHEAREALAFRKESE